MDKFKCKFTYLDCHRILELLDDRISYLQNKEVHEMSEIIVYRLFAMYALCKRFHNKKLNIHSEEQSVMKFDLKEVLTLKFCLMDHLTTPGLAKIFMQLDSKIHPAIQLEL